MEQCFALLEREHFHLQNREVKKKFCRCFSSHLSTKSFFVDKISKAEASTGRNRKLDGWVSIPMISAFPANAVSKLFLSPKSAFLLVKGDHMGKKKRDHLREHLK